MMSDLRSCRVLVTPTSYAKDDPRLRTELETAVGQVIYNPTGRPLSAAELADLLPGCHGYIAGLDRVHRTALGAADRLRVIDRYGAGVDRVSLEGKVIATPHTDGATNAMGWGALRDCLAVLRGQEPAHRVV